LLYNIAVAALRIATIFWFICDGGVFELTSLFPLPNVADTQPEIQNTLSAKFSAAYVPVFLWISDAFLVSILCDFQRDQ
jgi:hypothetical protein